MRCSSQVSRVNTAKPSSKSPFSFQSGWQTVYGVGFTAALYVITSTAGKVIQLQSLDYVLSDGGVL